MLTIANIFKYKKKFYGYLAYAWLSPLVVIVPCLCCDLFETNWFQYGDTDHCWISNVQKYILLYTFAAPVVFLVMINTGFLVRCAISLCMTFRDINQGYHVNQRQIFRTFCCLFMFSGITWLLGLLPAITGLGILWYPFVITKIFQGVFIFFIFGLPNLRCRNTPEAFSQKSSHVSAMQRF